jgi:hypothetical protein
MVVHISMSTQRFLSFFPSLLGLLMVYTTMRIQSQGTREGNGEGKGEGNGDFVLKVSLGSNTLGTAIILRGF